MRIRAIPLNSIKRSAEWRDAQFFDLNTLDTSPFKNRNNAYKVQYFELNK